MHSIPRHASGRASRQTGMILPLAVLSILTVTGLVGAGIDMAFLIWKKRQLQAAVEAAALAGAQDLLTQDKNRIFATVSNYVARTKSGSLGGGGEKVNNTRWYNDLENSGNVEVNPFTEANVVYRALDTNQVGLAPGKLSGANALRVTQTAKITPFFLGVFGLGPFTISASAAASAGGSTGKPPVNVALIIDTTGSMGDPDSQCKLTKIACALKGARSLATQLQGKGVWLGLLTFPPLSATGVAEQKDCKKPNVSTSPCEPDVTPHMLPRPDGTERWRDTSTYNTYSTIVPMIQPPSYITNNKLDGTTELGQALSVSSTCGLETPKCGVDNNTHIAQAIFQAQAMLAAKKAEPDNDQENFMVILSDGDTGASTMAPDKKFKAKISRDVGSTSSGNVLQVATNSLTNWSLPLAVGDTITWSGGSAKITARSPTKSCNGKTCTGTGGAGTYALSASFRVTSDTDMSTPVTENPFYYNQCQQAIIAANMAKAAGTKVYVIGYAAESTASTCSLDSSKNGGSSISSPYVSNGVNTNACKTLQWMAGDSLNQGYPGSGSPYFYSTNTGQSGGCTSVNGIGAVDQLFEDIAEGISNVGSRVIPDDAW